LPNYTPSGWWECDVFEATPAGFMREYEVKVSRSDFFSDAKKARSDRQWVERQRDGAMQDKTKHQRLALCDPRGPQYFSFVVPNGLIAREECPAFAGLMYARQSTFGRVWIEQVKPAPKLHLAKMDRRILEHMRGIPYYRFLSLYLRQREEKR
jgi:hypothetical protein